MFLIELPPLPSLRRITQAPAPLTLRRYPKLIPSPSPTKMGFLAAGSLRRLVRASIGLRGVRAMVHSVQVWRGGGNGRVSRRVPCAFQHSFAQDGILMQLSH